MIALFLALAGLATAAPSAFRLDNRQYGQSYVGIATMNDFSAQGSTVCGPKSGMYFITNALRFPLCVIRSLGTTLTGSGQSGTYGAAASDNGLNVRGGVCTGRVDMSQCNGQSPVAGYVVPSCAKGNCGQCYTVTHTGSLGSSIGGVGNTITVQIIDVCPSTSAQNFCKTDMPANQRCGDPTTNQLDIDSSAYLALTGQPAGGVSPSNLCIWVKTGG